MQNIVISVVIPTYNRSANLSACLGALEHQTFSADFFEVIVVNDGSTDSTSAVLSSFKKQAAIQFSYISQENRGVTSARNAGIDIATGEYIAFIDDDCLVPPTWLEQIISLWKEASPEIAGIGGPLSCFSRENSQISKFIQYLDEFNDIPVIGKYFIRPIHISKLTDKHQVAYLRTSNAVFRKNCLTEIGGFDINFKRPGGEDPDLCYRLLNLDYKFLFDKKLDVLHQNRESFIAFFKSLRNYLTGEIRKSKKRYLYNNKAIRRTYSLIPLQKIISFFLSLFLYPLAVIKMYCNNKYTFLENITFPLIVILSKAYALFFVISFYIGWSKEP